MRRAELMRGLFASGVPIAICGMLNQLRTLTGEDSPRRGKIAGNASVCMEMHASVGKEESLLYREPRMNCASSLRYAVDYYCEKADVS